LKTLATSGAIVLSAVLGWVLFGAQLDIFVTIGCICTILAIFNYTVSVFLCCVARGRVAGCCSSLTLFGPSFPSLYAARRVGGVIE